MPEYDQKERVLSGNTVEARDQAQLDQVRSDLRDHVRGIHGLPSEPMQLEADVLSQLSSSPVIDQPAVIRDTKIIAIDVSKLSAKHSVVALATHRERLEKMGKKAA